MSMRPAGFSASDDTPLVSGRATGVRASSRDRLRHTDWSPAEASLMQAHDQGARPAVANAASTSRCQIRSTCDRDGGRSKRAMSQSMSRSTLILGTRGSKLAVHQSQWVQARLQELAPGLTISLQAHPNIGRQDFRRSAGENRRQGTIRKGNRRRAVEQRDRPGRAQHERRADGIAGGVGDSVRASARRSAGCVDHA